jgi:hypothetical protein
VVNLGEHGLDDRVLAWPAVRREPGDGLAALADRIALRGEDEALVHEHRAAPLGTAVKRHNQVVPGHAVARLRALEDGRAAEAALEQHAAEGKVGQDGHAAISSVWRGLT